MFPHSLSSNWVRFDFVSEWGEITQPSKAPILALELWEDIFCFVYEWIKCGNSRRKVWDFINPFDEGAFEMSILFDHVHRFGRQLLEVDDVTVIIRRDERIGGVTVTSWLMSSSVVSLPLSLSHILTASNRHTSHLFSFYFDSQQIWGNLRADFMISSLS